MELQILNATFKDNTDMNRWCKGFIKEFAPKAINRVCIGGIKKSLHKKIVDACEQDMVGPVDMKMFFKPLKSPNGKMVSLPREKL